MPHAYVIFLAFYCQQFLFSNVLVVMVVVVETMLHIVSTLAALEILGTMEELHLSALIITTA